MTLKKTKKEKYKFIFNAGPALKEALFHLFQMVWIREEIPKSWNKHFILSSEIFMTLENPIGRKVNFQSSQCVCSQY